MVSSFASNVSEQCGTFLKLELNYILHSYTFISNFVKKIDFFALMGCQLLESNEQFWYCWELSSGMEDWTERWIFIMLQLVQWRWYSSGSMYTVTALLRYWYLLLGCVIVEDWWSKGIEPWLYWCCS